MKHLKFFLLLATAFVLLCTSCIKKEYDLRDGVDSTVKVGGDVIYVPIGSTDSIFLRDYLDASSIDLLDTTADGGFGIMYRDSTSLDIPEMDSNLLKLPDVVENRSESVNFEGINDISIDGINENRLIDMPFNEEFPEISITEINLKDTIYSGLWDILDDYPTLPNPFTLPSLLPGASLKDSVRVQFSKELPEMILSVDTVWLENPSDVAITIDFDNVPNGGNIMLDSLMLVFPPQVKLGTSPNVSGQTYLIEDEIVTQGQVFHIPISHLDFSSTPPVNHQLSMDEYVQILSRYSVSGTYTGGFYPTTPETDTRLIVSISSDLTVGSAIALVESVQESIPVAAIPFDLDIALDTMIKSIGTITLENAELSIDLNLPTISQDIDIEADPLNKIQIKFPKWFKFQDDPRLDQTTNIYSISGTIPPNITLTLDSLSIHKQLENGHLILRDSVVVDGGIQTTQGRISSDDFNALKTQQIGIIAQTTPISVKSVQISSISRNYGDSLSFTFTSDEIPEDIVSIDSVLLKSAQLKLELQLSETEISGNPLNIRTQIQLPQSIMFAPGELSAGNILDENLQFDNDGKWEKTLNIRGLKLDGQALNGHINLNEIVHYNVWVNIENPTIDISEIQETELDLGIHVALTNIKFDKVYGRIDPKIEPQYRTIPLDSLPSELKDDSIRLDVKPYLDLVMATNLQVPIGATVALTPYKNGAPVSGAQQETEISISKAPTADMKTTKFWLAATTDGMPDGYDFVEIDLGKLIRIIPDSLQIKIEPFSDPSEQAIFDLNAKYEAKLDYNFVAPLAFGPDLNIVIRKTKDSLDPLIGELLSEKKITLSGTILNSIPLGLEVTVTPLDSIKQIIPIEPAKLVVKPGAANGDAVESILDIIFDDPTGLLINLRGIELKIVGKTDPTQPLYTPIKPDNFVKVKLNAKFEGGVVIDLKQ